MKELKFETIKWSMAIGTNEGYNSENPLYKSLDEVVKIISKIADDVMNETDIYISTVVNDSRVIYKTEWGCPIDGEKTISISGICNDKFANVNDYLESLKLFTKKLKEELKQSTVSLEIVPATLMYFE